MLETSHLSYTPDRVSYDYNTNATISANYTVDPDSGYMVFAESPLNAQGSKYRVVAQWSGTDATGPYGRIFIGSQVWTKANTGADTPLHGSLLTVHILIWDTHLTVFNRLCAELPHLQL